MALVGTDGSCLRNKPGGGPTGWAYAFNDQEWKAGGLLRGTNQVGELMAVFMLLRDFPTIELTIQTDSKYVIGACETWKRSWQRKDYIGSNGNKLSNLNLIIPIHHLIDSREEKVTFQKVPGHDKLNRFPLNTLSDELARSAAHKARYKQVEVLLTP